MGLWFTVVERTQLRPLEILLLLFLFPLLLSYIYYISFEIFNKLFFYFYLTFCCFILFLFLFSEFILCCCFCLFSDLVLLVLFLSFAFGVLLFGYSLNFCFLCIFCLFLCFCLLSFDFTICLGFCLLPFVSFSVVLLPLFFFSPCHKACWVLAHWLAVRPDPQGGSTEPKILGHQRILGPREC